MAISAQSFYSERTPVTSIEMTQGVSANFAPHFAPSPAFVRLVRNSEFPMLMGKCGGFSKYLERETLFFGTRVSHFLSKEAVG